MQKFQNVKYVLLKKNCKFYKSKKKLNKLKKEMINKNINIFCYLSKNGENSFNKKK